MASVPALVARWLASRCLDSGGSTQTAHAPAQGSTSSRTAGNCAEEGFIKSFATEEGARARAATEGLAFAAPGALAKDLACIDELCELLPKVGTARRGARPMSARPPPMLPCCCAWAVCLGLPPPALAALHPTWHGRYSVAMAHIGRVAAAPLA